MESRNVLLLCIIGVVASEPIVEKDAFNSRSFRQALSQQGLQTILQSIEERLRNLDTVYSIRYSSVNVEQCSRKIDLLESKITRLEGQLEMQLTKINENMSSRQFKDEIMKDQIFRKLDSLYERLHHKMGYVEGKMDMDLLKIQSKMESTINKIDRLDHSISVRQADMETTITDGIDKIDNVKSNIEKTENKILNATKKSFEHLYQKQVQNMDLYMSNISDTIQLLEHNMTNSYRNLIQEEFERNDMKNETNNFMKRFDEYEGKINNYGNKMANMYNELWKKSEILQSSIKNNELNTNFTRKEIKNTLDILMKKIGNGKHFLSDGQTDEAYDVTIESFSNILQKRLTEISRKMESSFENVILGQHLFLESCHRIQNEESQLENKISMVLEKLLDSFMNKTTATFNVLKNLEHLVKQHDAQVFHNANQLFESVQKLTEISSQDRKELEKSFRNVSEELSLTINHVKQVNIADQNGHAVQFGRVSDGLDAIKQKLEIIRRDGESNKTNIPLEINKTKEKIKQLHTTVAKNNITLHSIKNVISKISHTLINIDTKLDNQKSKEIDLKIFTENKTELNEKLERYNYTILNDDAKSSDKPQQWLGLEKNSTEGNIEEVDLNRVESNTEIIDQKNTTNEDKDVDIIIDFTKFFGAKFSSIIYTDDEDGKTTTEEPDSFSTEQEENDYEEY